MDFHKDGKKRVLIFSLAYIPFVSGAELAVKEITDRINDLEFDLVTLRFDKKLPKFERVGNVNVYRINSSKLLFPFMAFLKGVKLNRRRKYSVVWSIMANRAGFAALFFKLWNPKVKYMLTLQEGDTLDYPEKRMGIFKIILAHIFRKIFTKADHIQAISNYLADWARSMGAKAPIEVVPNGASVENRLTMSVLKPTYDVGFKTIITTSRLVHKNGVDILIKAVAELYVQHRMSNIKLQILGSGPDEKKLKDLAKELKVDDIVQFLGHIEPEKVYEHLAEADIFVRPSRSEGLGSSFLEAMGAGLPIIATPVGGIPDFLKDGETGLFCEVDDPQDLAKKIKLLMADEELAKQISENGRQLIFEKYNWNNIAKQMQNTLSHIFAIAKIGDSGDNKLKILICTGLYPPDIGGPATYSKLLFEELPKMGIEADVLVFRDVKRFPYIIRHIVYFFKILKIGRKVDVIFAQDPLGSGLPASFAAKILRKKLLLKIVGDRAWETAMQKFKFKETLDDFVKKSFWFPHPIFFVRLGQKLSAMLASKIVVPSNYLKNIVLKWGINEEKIKVIYNAFDAPILKEKKEELRKKLNLSGTVLISAGRLVPWKGFISLIEIMPEILKAIPDAKLYIIGSGPESEALKLKVKNQKLENSIFLTGQIFHDKVLEHLKAGDIFILNTGYEGFSHFLLEAMAMEIPIITTRVGGNVELIESGKDGVLVEYNDKEELKKKIIELAENELQKYELTKMAKIKVAEFSKERMLEETVKILRQ